MGNNSNHISYFPLGELARPLGAVPAAELLELDALGALEELDLAGLSLRYSTKPSISPCALSVRAECSE